MGGWWVAYLVSPVAGVAAPAAIGVKLEQRVRRPRIRRSTRKYFFYYYYYYYCYYYCYYEYDY